MRHTPRAIAGIMALAALVLTGCGGSGSSSTSDATTSGPPTIAFKSSAIAAGLIPSRYTCDGENVAPPVEWGSVPASTKELVLFVLGLKPQLGTKQVKLSVEWAVAGVDPALHRLAAGRLPPGAHAGIAAHDKSDYSICPQKGKSEQYLFELYGLPGADKVPAGFNGAAVLSTIVSARNANLATGHGNFAAVYKRG